jgi:hypothetical protein
MSLLLVAAALSIDPDTIRPRARLGPGEGRVQGEKGRRYS